MPPVSVWVCLYVSTPLRFGIKYLNGSQMDCLDIDIHGPQRKTTDFGDPLTLAVAQPASLRFIF